MPSTMRPAARNGTGTAEVPVPSSVLSVVSAAGYFMPSSVLVTLKSASSLTVT